MKGKVITVIVISIMLFLTSCTSMDEKIVQETEAQRMERLDYYIPWWKQ